MHKRNARGLDGFMETKEDRIENLKGRGERNKERRRESRE